MGRRRRVQPERLGAARRLRRFVVKNPTVSSEQETGTTPRRLMRLKVGFMPTTPLKEAGLITDPAVCEPKAAGKNWAATPTADPLLEPPGVWSPFHGFRVGDGSPRANSVVTVLPIMTAPAALRRETGVES